MTSFRFVLYVQVKLSQKSEYKFSFNAVSSIRTQFGAELHFAPALYNILQFRVLHFLTYVIVHFLGGSGVDGQPLAR